MNQNKLDDFKVKILENLGEFDILTKYFVRNIEKRAFKRSINKRNAPTSTFPECIIILILTININYDAHLI